MAIKSPKAKGAAGELEAIRLLDSWATEAGYKLSLERNLEQVRHGGSDINGVAGLEIEIKRVESNAITQWWAQVTKQANRTGKHPVLLHRKNRQPWRMRTVVFAALYGEHSSGVVPMVCDMDLPSAKAWFIGYLKHATKEKEDE